MLNRFQYFPVINAAIVRTGCGPQFTAVGLAAVNFYQLAATVVLKPPQDTVRRDRCGQVFKITGWRSSKLGQLAKTPICWDVVVLAVVIVDVFDTDVAPTWVGFVIVTRVNDCPV